MERPETRMGATRRQAHGWCRSPSSSSSARTIGPTCSERLCRSGQRYGRLARRRLDHEPCGLLDREDVGVDDEVVLGRQLLVDVVEALQVVAPRGIGTLDLARRTGLVEHL